MADIKLGLEGSETTLPPISWIGDSAPDIPVGRKTSAERAEMLDGTARWNFKDKDMRTWSFEWARLTAAQVAAFKTLYDYRRPLHFQNNYIDAYWAWVVITDLEIRPRITTFLSAEPLYALSMTLEESG